MTKTIQAACLGLGLALGLAVASCAPAAAPAAQPVEVAGSEPGEEDAVLAALDGYLRALSASDLQELAALQAPDGMTYRAVKSAEGQWEVIERPQTFWLDPYNDPEAAYRARYWSPTVLVRGPIAVVWTPYEFWLNGETSHCGIELVNFVKMDGEWKVSASTWTVEPQACESLRPEDSSALRPVEQG